MRGWTPVDGRDRAGCDSPWALRSDLRSLTGMQSGMQEQPLLVSTILDYAARCPTSPGRTIEHERAC